MSKNLLRAFIVAALFVAITAIVLGKVAGNRNQQVTETVSRTVRKSVTPNDVVVQKNDALIAPIEIPANLIPDDLREPTEKSSLPDSRLHPISLGQFDHDANASFHPHGDQICASGCALSNHPTPALSTEDFRTLMQEFARDPMDGESIALETLLYYGPQTAKLISLHGSSPLDRSRSNFLNNELEKNHTRVSIRIVDEYGTVRASNEAAVVPLNRRHVFELKGNNLQPMVASGTVKRVGLDYLWTRL